MKFCVQPLLCTALLLSGAVARPLGRARQYPSWQAKSARDLSDKAQTSLNREVIEQAGGTSLRPPNSEPQSGRPQSTSKFVTVDGTRLHFAIRGAGRPLVLIHGNPGSAQDWTRVFGPLATNHKVIAFDRPGHGHSERPKHGDTTVEVQARLLHDALMQLHVER